MPDNEWSTGYVPTQQEWGARTIIPAANAAALDDDPQIGQCEYQIDVGTLWVCTATSPITRVAVNPASLVTTKGDLLAATASGTLTRVAAGNNGYALLADSQQTAGVRSGGPIAEPIVVSATAATGTINLDASTAPILYYTTAASANHTLNVRYSASVSLNTYMSTTGSALTVVWMNTNGATAYWPSSFTIDGSAQTVKWAGSTVSAGNASAVDVYTYTIIKTANATYTVLGSQTKYV